MDWSRKVNPVTGKEVYKVNKTGDESDQESGQEGKPEIPRPPMRPPNIVKPPCIGHVG